MIALIGFMVVTIASVPIVVYLGRNAPLRENQLPWDLVEVASRQIVVLGGLAGFAVTNIVLLVTFAPDRIDSADPFDAVITMFLVAYFFYAGTAVLMGYIPREDSLNPHRPRVQFVLATLLQYRTIFLGWFAMQPLIETFGLDVPAQALRWLLGVSAIIGTFFTGAIFHRVGVLEPREMFLVPLLAVVGGAIYAVAINAAGRDLSHGAALHLAAAFFFLNTLTFIHFSLGTVGSSLPVLSMRLDKYSRHLVLADMQTTTILIATMFLSVLGLR